MKARRSVPVILSALAGGVGVGWWLREVNAATAETAGPAGQKPVASQPAAGAPAPPDFPDTAPVSLPEWDPARTAEENALEMYAALERIPAARIAEMLNTDYRLPVDASSSSRAHRAWEVTREALLDRLREKDPAAFAVWVAGAPPDHLRDTTWVRDAAEALRRAGTPEAAAAAEKLKAAHPERWRAEELRILSGSDPEAALAMAAADTRAGLPETCAALLAADPPRALAFVRDHPSLLRSVAEAFRKLGPEALESFAEKCPGDAETTGAVWEMVAADRARRGNGKEFAAFLLAHPGIQETSAHLLAEADPAAAAEAVRALAGSLEVQERVLASLARRDPALAARLFAASPDAAALLGAEGSLSIFRRTFFADLAWSWRLRDPAAFRAWTRSLPPALQAGMLPGAAETLEGEEFLDFTRGAPLADERAAQRLAREAARKAPDSARLLAWLSGFPEADREKLTGAVTGSLASTDLPAATELTVNYPDLQRREEMIKSVAVSARFPDPAAAAAWGNSLPGDLRVDGVTAALQGAAMRAGGWAGAPGEAAAAVIAAEPPESAAVWSPLAEAVARDIARKNFGDGAAFLAALPETARPPALRALAEGLLTTMTGDPETQLFPAVESLERVTDPAVRGSLAEILLASEPVFRWLSTEHSAALTGRLRALTQPPAR